MNTCRNSANDDPRTSESWVWMSLWSTLWSPPFFCVPLQFTIVCLCLCLCLWNWSVFRNAIINLFVVHLVIGLFSLPWVKKWKLLLWNCFFAVNLVLTTLWMISFPPWLRARGRFRVALQIEALMLFSLGLVLLLNSYCLALSMSFFILFYANFLILFLYNTYATQGRPTLCTSTSVYFNTLLSLWFSFQKYKHLIEIC